MEKQFTEKNVREKNGWLMFAVFLLLTVVSIVLIVIGLMLADKYANDAFVAVTFAGVVLLVVAVVMIGGFKLLQPNEA